VFRIVAGIDFDTTGDNAFAEGIRIAAGIPGAELHVVHAIAVPADGLTTTSEIDRKSDLLEETPKRLRNYVTNHRAALPTGTGPRVFIHARLGQPAQCLVQLSIDLDADLIVVGTHGRQGLRKLALGSVAQRLSEIAHCPVLIARPKDYTGLERSP